jgi:GNAT superfamily N-acetyltransferase
MAVEIREATSGDEPFLRTMLYEAARWNTDWPVEPIEEVIANPVTARYIESWGRPGDVGTIAMEADEPIGAAWYRRFPADAPGYGFVDEQTPELSIAVARRHRRKGVGTALLRSLIERARADGVRALSLSVAPHNQSRMLYQREGFVKVGESEGSWTMRLDL